MAPIHEALRMTARLHCEALGHNLDAFERIPTLARFPTDQAWKTYCIECGHIVFVSRAFGKWRRESGRHGLAAMMRCPGNPHRGGGRKYKYMQVRGPRNADKRRPMLRRRPRMRLNKFRNIIE